MPPQSGRHPARHFQAGLINIRVLHFNKNQILRIYYSIEVPRQQLHSVVITAGQRTSGLGSKPLKMTETGLLGGQIIRPPTHLLTWPRECGGLDIHPARAPHPNDPR